MIYMSVCSKKKRSQKAVLPRLVALRLRFRANRLVGLWRGTTKTRLGRIRQQALQVQQGSRVINCEAAHIADPRGKIRHHHRLAVSSAGKSSLPWKNPAKVTVRADLRDFWNHFIAACHQSYRFHGAACTRFWLVRTRIRSRGQ